MSDNTAEERQINRNKQVECSAYG